LTTDDDGPSPVGILLPTGDTPWGCLFLILVAGTVLIAIFSSKAATLICLVGLITLYGMLNHPRRKAADGVRRSLRLIAVRKSKRAREALETALHHLPYDEGLNYLAALVELYDHNPAEALEHLDLASPKMSRFAEFHHLKGRCLSLIGRTEEARLCYERGLGYAAYPARTILEQELETLDSGIIPEFKDDDIVQ
jgi:tetratricopeptide (TPR) repeat protein